MVTAQQQLEFEVRLRDFMTKELKRLGAQVSSTTTKAESAFKRLQRQLGLTGAAAKRLGTVMKAMGLGALFMGIRAGTRRMREFSRAMAEVSTIMDTSKLSLADAEAGVRALSNEFAQASPEVAAGLYQTLSAGITDAKEAMILLGGATEIGVAGLATTRQSVDLLTSVFNAYGKTVTEEAVTATNDMIFKTIELGKTTMPELASSFGRILPMASTLGIEFEEIAAAVASLTLSGLDTAEAVTQVGAVFTAFLRKAELSKEMLGDYSDVMGAAAMRTKGFKQSIEDLVDATGHNDDVLVKLMGRVEGVKAIMALTGNQAETFADQIEQIGTASGNAQRAASLMMDTVDAKMRAMGEGWKTLWEGFMLGLTGVSDQLKASEITEHMDAMSDKASVVGKLVSTAFFSIYGAIEQVGVITGNVFRGQGTRMVEEMGLRELQEAFDTLEYSSATEKFRDSYLGVKLDIDSVIGSIESEISLRRTQLTLARNVGAEDTAAHLQSEIRVFKEKIELLKEEREIRAAGGRGVGMPTAAAIPLAGIDLALAETAAQEFRERFDWALSRLDSGSDPAAILPEVESLMTKYNEIIERYGEQAVVTHGMHQRETLVGDRDYIEQALTYYKELGTQRAAEWAAADQAIEDQRKAHEIAMRQQPAAEAIIEAQRDAGEAIVEINTQTLRRMKEARANYDMSTRDSLVKEVKMARKTEEVKLQEFEFGQIKRQTKLEAGFAKERADLEEALREDQRLTEEAIRIALENVDNANADELALLREKDAEALEDYTRALKKKTARMIAELHTAIAAEKRVRKTTMGPTYFMQLGITAANAFITGWRNSLTSSELVEMFDLTSLGTLEGLVSPTAAQELETMREALAGARVELAWLIENHGDIVDIEEIQGWITNVEQFALVEAIAADEIERFGVAARDVAGLMASDLAAAAGTMSDSLVFLSGMVVPDAIEQFKNFQDQIANARIEAQSLFAQGLISEAQLDSLQQMIDKLERIQGLELQLAAEAQALDESWESTGATWENITDSMSAGMQTWADNVGTMNENIQDLVNQGMDMLVGSMMAYVDGTKSAKEAFNDFAKQFLLMIVQMILKQQILNLLQMFGFATGGVIGGGTGGMTALAEGGVVSGGLGGALPVKGYATGGPIMKSPHIALMGEGRYNEAVVPLPDGKSIPVQMSGENQGPSVNIQIDAVDAQSVDELLVSRQDTIRGLIRQAMVEDRAFRDTFTTTRR